MPALPPPPHTPNGATSAGHPCLPVRSHRASAKRALNIICHEAESYAHALQLSKLDMLDDRSVHLCYEYMAKMKSPCHPLHHLLPSPLLDVPNYILRQKTQRYYLFRNMQVCRTKRVEDFFTFKCFSDSIVSIIVITVNYYTLDISCLKIVKCTR